MLRRSFQIIKRFNHEHSHKPNAFLPKNDFKIDYNKCHESEDKFNENIQDIKTNVAKIAFYIEMTSISIGSYALGNLFAVILFKQFF
jgi:hypothetical protein